MKNIITFAVLALSLLPQSGKAAGLTIGGDAGIDIYGANEVGFNLYPGYDLERAITPELQLGFRYAAVVQPLNADGLRGDVISSPLYAGGRYRVPEHIAGRSARPFIGAHAGMTIVHVNWYESMSQLNASDTRAFFGFNVGGGVDFKVTSKLLMGAAIWYDVVVVPEGYSRWATMGLSGRYTFA